MTVAEQISRIGIVPVIKITKLENAVPLARALVAGGIPAAEVTFRAEGADRAIRAIAEGVPEMLVGAGTVLTTQQVDSAWAAGAKFMVAPGLNPTVVRYCTQRGIPIFPGCANPSDVEAALELGLTELKFFPAEQAGGLPYLKAICAPYGQVRFMPTGGINMDNLNDYLRFPRVLACGGSWMVREDLIDSGSFGEIERLSRLAVEQMLGFELAHLGINYPEPAPAQADAARLEQLFGLEAKSGMASIFSGGALELMKQPGRGTHGHIAIRTRCIERAVYQLERRGVELDWQAARYDSSGKLSLIYLQEELGGFALHLVQKK